MLHFSYKCGCEVRGSHMRVDVFERRFGLGYRYVNGLRLFKSVVPLRN